MGRGSQIRGDGRGTDSGQRAHSAAPRRHAVELHTWSLRHFTDQCHPIHLIIIKKEHLIVQRRNWFPFRSHRKGLSGSPGEGGEHLMSRGLLTSLSPSGCHLTFTLSTWARPALSSSVGFPADWHCAEPSESHLNPCLNVLGWLK